MVKDKKLIQNYGQNILQRGFTAIPNLLLERQIDLNLSDNEVLFYIKCYMIHSKKYVKNKDLSMACSGKTIQRIKQSLCEKGYLASEELYLKDEKGRIMGVGTKYDWMGLVKKLDNLPIRQFDQKEDTEGTICPDGGQIVQAKDKKSHTSSSKERIEKERLEKERINNMEYKNSYSTFQKNIKSDRLSILENVDEKPKQKPLLIPQTDFKYILDLYFKLYESRFNKKPMFDASEGKAIKNILSKTKVHEFEEYLVRYMNTENQFYISQGLTLKYFQSAIKSIMVGGDIQKFNKPVKSETMKTNEMLLRMNKEGKL